MGTSLSPSVEQLLKELDCSQPFNVVRMAAARKIGKLEQSHPRVVEALIAAVATDPTPAVREVAAEALRTPVHQAVLAQQPDLTDRLCELLDLPEIEKPTPSVLRNPQFPKATYTPEPARISSTPEHVLCPTCNRYNSGVYIRYCRYCNTDLEDAPRTETGDGLGVPAEQTALGERINSWGWSLIVLGGLHLVAAGTWSAPWGIILLFVGATSLFFQTAGMFLVYGITLGWAGVSNLLSGDTGWSAFALIQVLLAGRLFYQFLQFRAAEQEVTMEDAAAARRAARLFPYVSGVLGGLSLLGLLGAIVAIVLVADATRVDQLSELLGFTESLAIDLAVLALAFGLATFLCAFRPRSVAALGIGAAVLALLVAFTPGAVQSVYQSADTVLRPTQRSAADINLQPTDLQSSFHLIRDEGVEAFDDTDLKDRDWRLYLSTDAQLVTQVLWFRFRPSDTTDDMGALYQQSLRDSFDAPSLAIKPGVDIPIGDRGRILEFSDPARDLEGCTLFFFQDNVMVEITAFGSPGALTADDVQALARTIQARIP